MKARTTLLLIAAVCALPAIAAFVGYYVWQPTRRMNHGELLAPAPMRSAALATAEGGVFDLAAMSGKWILLQVDTGACGEPCRLKLYTMRQVRIAQGKDMGRIERVWLLSDTAQPAPGLLSEYEGTRVVRAAGSPLLAALPAPRDRAAHLYVIDLYT